MLHKQKRRNKDKLFYAGLERARCVPYLGIKGKPQAALIN